MPVRYNKITPQDINIQEPFKVKMGVLAKFDPLAIQLPAMQVPYTCTPMPPMSGVGQYKCKLALSFADQPDGMHGDHKELYDMLQDIDSKALEFINANVKRFFPNKKPPNVDIVRTELWHPSVKVTEDYNPVFQAKVDFEEGELAITSSASDNMVGDPEHSFNLKVSCYDQSGTAMPAELALTKRNTVVAIATPEYIWCISGRCGITWKIPRCVVTELATDETAFDFDLTEDDRA